MSDFSRIIEIDPGIYDISDENGESMYIMNCQLSSCGQPMFSKYLRRRYVCRECSYAHNTELAAEKQRKFYETYKKTCFCGNEFDWSTRSPKQKYCSALCCSRASWKLRSMRI